MNELKVSNKQKGVATLFTAVVMLFAVTMISLNASKLGVLELFISNNYESKQVAFNHSESSMDALYSLAPEVIDLNDPVGHIYCTTKNDYFVSCTENNITTDWPTEYSPGLHQAQITFEGTGCPPRYLESSCAALNVSHFTLRTIFDDRDSNSGRSETILGAMLVSPVTE